MISQLARTATTRAIKQINKKLVCLPVNGIPKYGLILILSYLNQLPPTVHRRRPLRPVRRRSLGQHLPTTARELGLRCLRRQPGLRSRRQHLRPKGRRLLQRWFQRPRWICHPELWKRLQRASTSLQCTTVL